MHVVAVEYVAGTGRKNHIFLWLEGLSFWVDVALVFISELAGLHQEEGTYWLPPGSGDLAEEQCSCAGEPGTPAYVLLFVGLWCMNDSSGELLPSWKWEKLVDLLALPYRCSIQLSDPSRGGVGGIGGWVLALPGTAGQSWLGTLFP